MAEVVMILLLATSGSIHKLTLGGKSHSNYFRQADLFSISNATDIHNTDFDDPTRPIAVNGTLNSSITPANYVSFVSFTNDTQLSRFGLHNGASNISTAAKVICTHNVIVYYR